MTETSRQLSGRATTTAVVWTVAAGGLLLAPLPPDLFEWESGWSGPVGLDKLVHVVLFFFLSRAWLHAPRAAGRMRVVMRVAAVSAYGGLLELLQGGLATRSAEWGDLVADTVGAALAIWTLHAAVGGSGFARDRLESEAR